MRRLFIVAALVICVAVSIQYFKGEMDLLSFIVTTAAFAVMRDVSPQPAGGFRFEIPPSVIGYNIQHKDFNYSSESFLRIYGKNLSDSQTQRSVLVFIHGGGFAIGSVDAENEICSKFVDLTSSLVVSLEYRKAPENRFPAALEDIRDGLIWVQTNVGQFGGDTNKLALMGESAGGNLAAAVSVLNVESNFLTIAPKHIFLIYPCVEQGSMRDSNFRYRNSNGFLTNIQMHYFWSLYITDDQKTDYRASPMLTPDDLLAKFPTTTVVLAKFDTLLDEGIAFAVKLRKNGVDVGVHVYNTTIHGFFGRFGTAGHDALKVAAKIFLDRLA